MPFISKSKYLSGLQCHKLLWHYYNAKDEIPAPDQATQAIFDQGHLIGELAKTLFPEGIEVAKGIIDFQTVVEQSKIFVSERRPLFEAAFKHKQAYARADILNPVGKVKWDIIEVKSSTQVKEINLHDLALQMYTYAGFGLDIRKCFIMHINNEYVRRGEIDPKRLFVQEDVTDEVKKLLPDIESNLEEMLKVIRRKTFPEIEIGPHCGDPYECSLIEKCWNFLPENNPLTLYYYKKDKAFSLIHDGITDILSIKDAAAFSDKQQIQINSLRTKKPYIDKKGVRSFLKLLRYPLYYLDFETFGTAIPIFDDSSPYQQIPFQFSLHVVEIEGAKPRHFGYLSNGKYDPRPEILGQLKNILRKKGSIICYNASFEKEKLKSASQTFSEYKEWYAGLEDRFIDLLAPFKSFYYYHPKQNGSASIKAVLPALTGVSYENMEIADGGTASNEYLRVTFRDVSEKDRNKVRKSLEEYCKMDTDAMVRIVGALRKLSE